MVLEGFNAEQYDPVWRRPGGTDRPGFRWSTPRCGVSVNGLAQPSDAIDVRLSLLPPPPAAVADRRGLVPPLIDASAASNYTQWQSQCGLVGKPALRLYNPRKQVRDQDPDGEFIRQWVPELESLPDEYLDRPEQTPSTYGVLRRRHWRRLSAPSRRLVRPDRRSTGGTRQSSCG